MASEDEPNEIDDLTPEGCLFVAVMIWSLVGGAAFFMWSMGPHMMGNGATFAQRVFVAMLCGPFAWLAIVYEMLGWIGK